MQLLESVADDLAQQVLTLETRSGDETIAAQVGDAIGTSSPTMQEAFQTALRVRRAEARARTILDKHG